jgi:cysteinyl-tRNA synthetase
LEGLIGPYPRETEKGLVDLLDDAFMEQFVGMMDDDLNTAGAIGLVFEKVREINRIMDAGVPPADETARHSLMNDRSRILQAGRVLGLLQETPTEFFEQLGGVQKGIDPAEIEEMIEARAVARANKDWAKADEIRDRLKGLGIVLEDGPRGTTWRLDV